MALADKTIGFIGAGAMAEAILTGVLESKLIKADQIWLSDANPERLSYMESHFKVNVTTDNPELVRQVETVVLSVKPLVAADVLQEISGVLSADKLMVSVAAGLSTAYISSFLNERVPIVRVMPNTPCLVGEGASAVAAGENAAEDHIVFIEELFGSVGLTLVVKEQDMDAVTGLSGSGPAYMFLIIEALTDAGVKAGLTRINAAKLAAQTMYGAAKMVLETGEHPALLKDKVTTPGGTTITGLVVLEEGKVRATVIEAVLAAMQRSKELSKIIK